MSSNAQYTKNDGRTLTDEGKEVFSYEIALGYFSDEEIRRRFKMRPSAFEVILGGEEMQELIMDQKRKLDESDFALKVHARRAARVALEQYIMIVKDPEAPPKTRMEAGKQIREIASGVDKAVLQSGDTGEGAIIIKTNLDLKGAQGVYALTAEEISEQTEENERLLAAENNDEISAADAEIMALIGE